MLKRWTTKALRCMVYHGLIMELAEGVLFIFSHSVAASFNEHVVTTAILLMAGASGDVVNKQSKSSFTVWCFFFFFIISRLVI
jgi:hypothetical protein